MKKYIAKPEFVGRSKETEDLYNLEGNVTDHIELVAQWRVDNFDEDFWTEALPQTLRTILESFEKDSSEVAAKCFLSGKEEIKEVK